MNGTGDLRLLYNAYTPGRKFFVTSAVKRKFPPHGVRDRDRVSIIRGQKPKEPCGLQSDTIHGLFEHLAARKDLANQKAAVVYRGKSVTFGVLNATANAVARVIRHRLQAVTSNDSASACIGVYLNRSDMAVMLLMAILKLGASYLPLDCQHPEKRLKYVLANATPRCVITSADSEIANILTDMPEEDRPVVMTLDDLVTDAASEPCHDLGKGEKLLSKSSQTAGILYASGSAGFPQGVTIAHRSVIHRASALRSSLKLKDSDIGCWKSSLSCTDSLTEIFGFLLNGLTIVVVPDCATSSPEKLTQIFDENKVTRIFLAPTLLCSILSVLKEKPRKERLLSVETLVCTGGDLSSNLAKKCYSILPHIKLANTWGVAETCGDATLFFVKRRDIKSEKTGPIISLGLPIQNTNIYILDDNMTPVPVGDVGICYVSGPCISDGYLSGTGGSESAPRNKFRREKFSPNPFATDPGHDILLNSGEYMRLVCDSNQSKPRLMFEGRRDTIVNVNGNRIDLREIEDALSDVPFFQRVVVVYRRQHVDEEPTLLAFYQTLCDIPDCTPESIGEYLRSVLPSHMIPKLVPVDDANMLSNGDDCDDSLYDSFDETITNTVSNESTGDDTYDTAAHSSFDQTITNAVSEELTGDECNDALYDSFANKTIDSVAADPDSCDKSVHPDQIDDDSSPHACAIRSTVAKVLNIPENDISINDNYFQLRNSSVNAMDVITRIRASGLQVETEDFFSATTLEDLLHVEVPPLKRAPNFKAKALNDSFHIRGYKIVSLGDASAREFESVCRIVAETYTLNDPMVVALESPIEEKFQGLYDVIESLCDENLVLSFFVSRQKDGEVAAVCINQDLHHFNHTYEPSMTTNSHMRALFMKINESFQLLVDKADIQDPWRWCYTHFMAVNDREDFEMKVVLQKLLEVEKLRMARCHGFKGCCGIYSNPFSVAIATEVGYLEEAASDYVENFEFEGKRYFSKIQPPNVRMRALAVQMY